ncbi:MAG: RHS repeat protein, partial [Nitrospira sp.]|nr:RHS repeat protein [Nitrospira sp.]
MTITGYLQGQGIPTNIDFNGAFSIVRTAYWDGAMKSESNGRGDITTYTYDDAGRLKTIEPPGIYDASTYDYLPSGASFSITRGTGSTAYKQITVLDGLGRVIEEYDSLGDKQTREYDTLGRVIFASYPFATGDPEAGERVQYDALGRPTTTQGRFLASTHRPLTGSCAEPGKCKTTITYQGEHCRTQIIERGTGDSPATRMCHESYGDMSEERLVTVTDANGKVWTYQYDVVGNVTNFIAPQKAGNRSFTFTPGTFFPKTETSGPRGTRTILNYNAIGQPETSVEARQKTVASTTTYEYADPLSRPTLVRYGSGSPDDVTRTYDRDVLWTVSRKAGGTYTYSYDELNRPKTQTWVSAERGTYSTAYKFDHTGCLEGMTYPTGTTLSMTCDSKGRPTSVKKVEPSGTQVTIAEGIGYHPSGRVKSMKYGNGKLVTTTFEYGRVKSIATSGILDLTYTYDGANNVKSITDQLVPANTVSNIVYDNLDRLEDVSMSNGKITYHYDPLGNRTEKILPGPGNSTIYVYDPETNRLTASQGPNAPALISLKWNHAGQMESSSDGAVYGYDGLGRRIAKLIPSAGTDILYHYDMHGRLLAETSNGARIREYYYVGEQLVAVDGCLGAVTASCNELEWYH